MACPLVPRSSAIAKWDRFRNVQEKIYSVITESDHETAIELGIKERIVLNAENAPSLS
jgi:hypothetical protein